MIPNYIFRAGGRWERADDPALPHLKENDSFDQCMSDAGYDLMCRYGAEWLPIIDIYQPPGSAESDQSPYIVTVTLGDYWRMVYCPTTPDLLSFVAMMAPLVNTSLLSFIDDVTSKLNYVLDREPAVIQHEEQQRLLRLRLSALKENENRS